MSYEVGLYLISLVGSGSFKIVLLTPKQEIIKIAEQSSKGHFEAAALKGKYSIKIVGKNASGNIQIEFSADDGNKISENFY